MILDFESIKPEAAGIASSRLINFVRRLENQNIPMHSIIIMRHGKICMETYYAPYTKDTLHRMFSVTKSMVSLAIGLLADEGKISLDDHIVDYFPEKLPEAGAHPYLKMLTIRQMLTCPKVVLLSIWRRVLLSSSKASYSPIPFTCFMACLSHL